MPVKEGMERVDRNGGFLITGRSLASGGLERWPTPRDLGSLTVEISRLALLAFS